MYFIQIRSNGYKMRKERERQKERTELGGNWKERDREGVGNKGGSCVN